MASAAIAGANADRVGWHGCRLAYAGFLLPFLFVVRPELLLEGEPFDVAAVLLAAFASVLAFSYVFAGTVRQSRIHWAARCLLAAVGLVVLVPGTTALVLGIVAPMAAVAALVGWAASRGRPARDGTAR